MPSTQFRRARLGACLLALIYTGALAAAPSVHPAPPAAAPDLPYSTAVTAAPLTLRQALSAALQGNPQLRTFAFQLRAGDARTRQAALRPAPALSVDMENFAGSGAVRSLDAAEATFALSQVIELGGKRAARIGAAQAGRAAIDIEQQAVQLDVLAEVTRRFIAVAQRQQRVQLARTAAEFAGKTVAASERRVNAAKA